MLGRFLARGLGGEADPKEARKWLERALKAGVADAQPDLDALNAANEPVQAAARA
jgi:TPR repeat protein